MRHLVVTQLDGAAQPQAALAGRELAALGLLRCLADGRDGAHALPAGTFAGVLTRAAARARRERRRREVCALLGPRARVREHREPCARRLKRGGVASGQLLPP